MIGAIASHYAASGGYSAAVLADSPLLYWKLDETSGAAVADSSGNSRDGTYDGTPTLGDPPLAPSTGGTAVTFTGADGARRATIDTALTTTQWTVEMWLKTTTTARSFLAHRFNNSTSQGHWALILNDTGKPAGTMTASTSATGVAVTTPAAINNGAARHVVVTQSASTLTVYIDGASVASAASAPGSAVGGSLYLAQAFTLGVRLAGTVDEFAVYGTALSSTRIAAHYAAA